MGTGTYGHASAILLKGQEKAAATRAKRKREERYAKVTAEDLDVAYEGGKVCPSCLRLSFGKETCDHRHPEDNEIFVIPTVEVRLVVVPPVVRDIDRPDGQNV